MANFIVRAMLFFTGFTLPLSFVQVYAIGPFGITPNKISAAGLLSIAILLGVVERRSLPHDPKGWWVIGFASSMLIGATMTLARGAPLGQMLVVFTVLAAVVIFYFLLVYVIRSLRDLDVLLVGLILGVALSSLSVIMQWGSVQSGRTGGFSGDPNNYAFVSAMTLPILGYYLTTWKSPLLKLLLIGMALLQLVAIAASLSRTGVVCLGVMGLMWMARFRRFDILRVAIPIGALLVVTIFFAAPDWRERMTTLTDRQAASQDGSMQKRLLQNTLALEAFVTNPILGVGYKQLGHWAGGDRQLAIHNSYLHVLAELGLLGILCYLGLIAATFMDYARCRSVCLSFRARGDPLLEKLYLLATLMQISLVGTIVGNLFLSSLRYRISWMLYACSAVVLIMARRRANELLAESPAQPRQPEWSPAHIMDTGPEQPVRA